MIKSLFVMNQSKDRNHDKSWIIDHEESWKVNSGGEEEEEQFSNF